MAPEDDCQHQRTALKPSKRTVGWVSAVRWTLSPWRTMLVNGVISTQATCSFEGQGAALMTIETDTLFFGFFYVAVTLGGFSGTWSGAV